MENGEWKMENRKKILCLLLAGMIVAGCTGRKAAENIAPEPDRSDFVEVSEAVPDVILEIRYYSTYNFVGTRIDGYARPLALMTRQAADSLRKVSDEMKAQGYRLKIWDTYRPQRAVNHFIRWAEDLQDTAMKAIFYPMVDKSRLFEEGYIYARSSHSRGSTVDLTLVDEQTGKELDMGSPFDWFGVESHPDYKGEGDSENWQANRLLLHDAMVRHGFEGIDSEWWHFTLANEPYPDTYFDFVIE
jgi:D-alanyl-D-alanine dipeptidase